MTAELPTIVVDDMDIVADQGRVRGLVLQRLELAWRAVEPHLDGSIEALGYRPDPRMVQSAIHILDRLARLYRLASPAPVESVAGSAVADREIVARSLAELEAKINSAP